MELQENARDRRGGVSMQFLAAVIGCTQGAYPKMEEGIRETWGSKVPEGMELVFYYGQPGRTERVGDRVFLDCKDDAKERKALLFFRKMLSDYPDLQYVFFTNLSSYVRLNLLLEKFRQLKGDIYSGLIGYHDGVAFASGAGFFISRNFLQILADSYDQLNGFPGDAAYGEFFGKRGVEIIPQPRLDIVNMEHMKRLKREDIINHYHFRCAQPVKGGEVDLFHEIHKLLGGA